tara:strand:+ start:192 stop:566 length:375 start_codon:yes stop_codon:yes gene_type:complete
MSKYREKFIEANDWFKVIGLHNRDRKAIFLELVGDTEEHGDVYQKEVYRNSAINAAKKAGSFYKLNKKNIIKFQKTDKYRSYRRKYEAGYRDEYRMRVNYNSWKSITKPTPMQEIDYLLKRFLR